MNSLKRMVKIAERFKYAELEKGQEHKENTDQAIVVFLGDANSTKFKEFAYSKAQILFDALDGFWESEGKKPKNTQVPSVTVKLNIMADPAKKTYSFEVTDDMLNKKYHDALVKAVQKIYEMYTKTPFAKKMLDVKKAVNSGMGSGSSKCEILSMKLPKPKYE